MFKQVCEMTKFLFLNNHISYTARMEQMRKDSEKQKSQIRVCGGTQQGDAVRASDQPRSAQTQTGWGAQAPVHGASNQKYTLKGHWHNA